MNELFASRGWTPEAFYVAFEKRATVDISAECMADMMWCCLDYEPGPQSAGAPWAVASTVIANLHFGRLTVVAM